MKREKHKTRGEQGAGVTFSQVTMAESENGADLTSVEGLAAAALTLSDAAGAAACVSASTAGPATIATTATTTTSWATWVDAVRVLARDASKRKEMRQREEICAGVARAIETTVTAGAAALANLVVDDDESMQACTALEAAIVNLAKACVAHMGDESGTEDASKFEMISTIALRNISQQVSSSKEASLLIGRLADTGLRTACFAACCRASSSSTRENALGAVDAFCEGSAETREAFLGVAVESPSKAQSLDIVSEALERANDERGSREALELVQRICEHCGALERESKGNATAAMPASAVRVLCKRGMGRHLGLLVRDAIFRARAAGVLTEMAKLALTPQGAPEQDEDFEERIALLQKEGVTTCVLEALESARAPFGEAEICLAQLLAALVMPLSADGESSGMFAAARDALAAAVRNASEALGPMVGLLRSNASGSPDTEVRIRGEILPLARFRLFCLGGLNSLSGSPANAAGFLAEGSQVCAACAEVIAVTFDFDIEATRFALNVLRNLCLEEANRVKVLDAVADAQALGAMLARVATMSKDPNSAGLAAAVVRLVASSRDAALLERVLSPKSCDSLVLAARGRTLAFAHVEIGRALAHAAVALKDSLQQEGLGRHVGVTAAMNKVCFLLQSDQEVLHVEALEALSVCPAALLASLQSTVSLEVRDASKGDGAGMPGVVSGDGSSTSGQKLSLRERLEQLISVSEEGRAAVLAKSVLDNI
ncbi:Hypothetical Protein FCC1311_109432 [Hondaea fermentalgiana]|uniref:Uncharacterized protein n=1 Tax=Hondaea fermentalgiana TaxID=2315210 RepID=A0A2R5H1N4_9STRA|nr:Hypothetical Protein FCC1311_109432 [Hondaea fermentalgiana]|eukprot:GBG34721.1 Hypothetical Protein FCC1311_109432 [Hondaea fermentalgiana]